MSTDVCAVKRELAVIFPQHNEATITKIYNDVIENSSDNDNVLPTCIEHLLQSSITEDKDGDLEDCKKIIKSIINNVDDTYLEKIIIEQEWSLPNPDIVNNVIEYLLEHDYPKVNEVYPTNSASYSSETFTSSANALKNNEVNSTCSTSYSSGTHITLSNASKNDEIHLNSSTSYSETLSCSADTLEDEEVHATNSTSYSSETLTSSKYNEQSVILLQNKFPNISSNTIKKVFSKTNSYSESFTELNNVFKQIISGETKVESTFIKSFLRKKRAQIKIGHLCDILAEEVLHLEESKKDKIDLEMVVDGSSKQTDIAQTIECGCCYSEVAFEVMVQCMEGHLFCSNCLQNYSKEAVYGIGKIKLVCMTDGCGSTFPMSQLKKALHGNILEKYMERLQNEDIKLAKLDNLVKCPGCDFAAEMDDNDKVFCCQNPSCMKETCRYCQEEWKEHFGIPCKEVEKNKTTNLRTSYEEKMTQAKVRKCWQCGTIFLKSDGCNKMTCRCGAKMCYICREGKIDYNHFCQHPRDAGEGCNKCEKCSLWTDPSEDDDRAVAEIKKQAEEEGMKIPIGPSVSNDQNDKVNSSDNHGEYYGSSEDDSDDDDSDDDMYSSVASGSSHDFSGFESMGDHDDITFHSRFDTFPMDVGSSSDSDYF